MFSLIMPGMEPITLVSGLPRSGTSLLMQMLAKGGMPILSDELRAPDMDNPHGYYEYTPVKHLHRDNTWLPLARGKALKVVAPLLPFLPAGETYRVLFVYRPMQQVLASQAAMMQRRGATTPFDEERMEATLQKAVVAALGWARAHASLLEIQHGELMQHPAEQAKRIASFAGCALDTKAMAEVIDPTCYRNRD